MDEVTSTQLEGLIDEALALAERTPQHVMAFASRLRALSQEPETQLWADCLSGVSLARTDLEQALALLLHIEQSDYPHQATDVLAYLGKAYNKRGDYNESLDYYNRALDLLRVHPNPSEEAQLLFQIGQNYLAQEWHQLALFSFEQALGLAHELASTSLEYQAHEQLAAIYEQQAKPEAALAHFKSFFSLKESIINEKTNQRINQLVIARELEQLEREKHLIAQRNHDLEQRSAELSLTLSLGLASANEVDSAAALLEVADHKLYQAKHTGRNRVVA